MSRKRVGKVRERGSVKSEYTIRYGAGVGVIISVSTNYICTYILYVVLTGGVTQQVTP